MPLGTLLQFMLPRWSVIPLARLAGLLAFRFNHRLRARMLETQRHLLGPEADEPAVRRSAQRAFIHLAMNYADLLRAPVLRRRVTRLAQGEIGELDRVLARGRGCVLVTAHVGNWDLAGIYLTALGYPLAALVEPVPAGWSRTFNRYRSLMNLDAISMHDRDGIARALARRPVFTLVADRDLTGRGLLCPAFDSRRSYPRGPAAYALRHRMPLVIGYFVFRPEPGRPPYLGVIEPEIEFTPTGDLTRDVDELTWIVAARINRVLARYPDQWLVFRGGWQ